jgi:signal transduction histidine kinase
VEAVTNVARHAGVSAATVRFIVTDPTRLQIAIEDEGRSTQPWQPGIGLASMKERVEQIGGTLTIRSGPHGTCVTADLPLTIPPAT